MSRNTDPAAAAIDFLALGDSYTIGEGVGDDERWPVQLAAALRARGLAVAHPHVIARSGWTTDELSAAIDDALAQRQLLPRYGLVSLLIGVNDQYRGRTVFDYALRFSALLERAIGFAGDAPGRVLVLSIPDWGGTPFARAGGRDAAQVAAEIDAYNAAAAAVCQQRRVGWCDITGLTRQADLAEELVADGLHPSGRMYSRWVERVRAALPAL